MRWNLIMLFDDTALPFLDSEDDRWLGSKEDCSDRDFDDLADYAFDSAVALLEGRVDLDDAEVKLIVSERFQDRAWVGGQSSSRSHCSNEWRQAFDGELPSQTAVSASAIQSQLADNPAVRAAMEREWMDAAVRTLNTTQNVDLALRLLEGVRSLRRQIVPGARCFGEFDGEPAVFDCRRYVMGPGVHQPEGKLVLVKMEIREGG